MPICTILLPFVLAIIIFTVVFIVMLSIKISRKILGTKKDKDTVPNSGVLKTLKSD
jgi:hypothetical protein